MFNTHLYSCSCHKKLFKDHLIFIVLKKSCNKVVFILFFDKSFMLSEFILLFAVFSVALLLYYIDVIHDKYDSKCY